MVMHNDDLVKRLRFMAENLHDEGSLDYAELAARSAERIAQLHLAHRTRYDETVVQKHRISVLEAALRPFARFLEINEEYQEMADSTGIKVMWRVADLKQARCALEGSK